mmetsp:Transcript_182/g.449  ORF Transcript_182/g.449 Transcript_182/m.449 type:complete len:236 (-) Transcript_182:43-750(-)
MTTRLFRVRVRVRAERSGRPDTANSRNRNRNGPVRRRTSNVFFFRANSVKKSLCSSALLSLSLSLALSSPGAQGVPAEEQCLRGHRNGPGRVEYLPLVRGAQGPLRDVLRERDVRTGHSGPAGLSFGPPRRAVQDEDFPPQHPLQDGSGVPGHTQDGVEPGVDPAVGVPSRARASLRTGTEQPSELRRWQPPAGGGRSGVQLSGEDVHHRVRVLREGLSVWEEGGARHLWEPDAL